MSNAAGCAEEAHHTVVVVNDLRSARHMKETIVEAAVIKAFVAEWLRVNAVVVRGKMQPNKWIGVVPMPTRSMVAVDHGDRSAAVSDECVNEGHPSCTATDNEIVCFYHCLGHRGCLARG